MTGSKDKFKIQLDKFLKKIPDEPQIPGYTQARQADTNSIPEMVRVGLYKMDW